MADKAGETSLVPMGDELFRFFQAHPPLSHAILTRKGRITAREVITSFGDNGYLSDTFCVGQVVQRAKVLVRETLVCSGRGNCQRLCGGFGQCMKDCQERRKRGSMGHRCRLKVKLTMSTDHFGTWKVVISGRHVPPGRVWRPPTKSALTDHEVSFIKKSFGEKRQELEEAWIAGCHGVREIALAVGDDSLTKAEIQNFIRTKRRQLRTVAWQPHHVPRTNRPRHHPWQLSHPPALLQPAPEVSLAPQVPFASASSSCPRASTELCRRHRLGELSAVYEPSEELSGTEQSAGVPTRRLAGSIPVWCSTPTHPSTPVDPVVG